MNCYIEIRARVIESGDVVRAKHSLRFFKTGKGEYGEGDKFVGVSMPKIRTLAKKLLHTDLIEIEKLLHDEIHDCRLLALITLVEQYKRGNEEHKCAIYELYLRNTAYINNWDLVDCSCYFIVGSHLLNKNRTQLYLFAQSSDLWEQRIAMVSTMMFLRNGEWEDTYVLAEILLNHSHDLIHKAVGWLLREMGKRYETPLLDFLNKYHKVMPRTMLRYAIERLPSKQKAYYMSK